jgi:hypothetical protein
MKTLVRGSCIALLLTTVTGCATTKNVASPAASPGTGSPGTDQPRLDRGRIVQSP